MLSEERMGVYEQILLIQLVSNNQFKINAKIKSRKLFCGFCIRITFSTGQSTFCDFWKALFYFYSG